jgi:hypothetical protein
MSHVLPELAVLRRVMSEPSDEASEFRVAVVTPYFKEAEALLAQCHESVRAQTHPCTHILVADGHPAPFVQSWAVQHIVLPRAHRDYGDTPRAIGSFSAVSQGFDAIAYLDADNWYAPDHIQAMVDLHLQARASVCVASRSLHRLDGSVLSPVGERGDGIDGVDTSCLFLTAAAYRVVPVWSLVPRRLHAIGDRVVWSAVRALGFRVARRLPATVRYRTSFRIHYEELGEAPPPGAKDHAPITAAKKWWRELPAEERELVFKRLGFRF